MDDRSLLYDDVEETANAADDDETDALFIFCNAFDALIAEPLNILERSQAKRKLSSVRSK